VGAGDPVQLAGEHAAETSTPPIRRPIRASGRVRT
jgi:hypothetical protein